MECAFPDWLGGQLHDIGLLSLQTGPHGPLCLHLLLANPLLLAEGAPALMRIPQRLQGDVPSTMWAGSQSLRGGATRWRRPRVAGPRAQRDCTLVVRHAVGKNVLSGVLVPLSVPPSVPGSVLFPTALLKLQILSAVVWEKEQRQEHQGERRIEQEHWMEHFPTPLPSSHRRLTLFLCPSPSTSKESG